MIERIALVALLVVAALAAFYLMRLVHMRRMTPAVAVNGQPTLLYFRSETCAVCPTQSRFIDQLAEAWDGRVRVEQIDAAVEPDKAGRFQVFTLPTTIIVDGRGQVRHVNYGLADTHKLARQLADVNGPAVASVSA